MKTLDDMSKLTMAQKLRVLREINSLSQEELGNRINVSDKTISAWEKEEREINLNNAKILAEIFNVPVEYFVFNTNYEKILTYDSKIYLYYAKENFKEYIEIMTNLCKQKLLEDKIPIKDEYLPQFNFEENCFDSYGIFEEKSLPIYEIEEENLSKYYGEVVDDKIYFNNIIVDINRVGEIKNYKYDNSAITYYGIYKYLKDYDINNIVFTECDDIDLFLKAIELEIFSQDDLNYILENLNPELDNYWGIVYLLIKSGAYYMVLQGYGDDVVCWQYVKDVARTNIVYRLAMDKINELYEDDDE